MGVVGWRRDGDGAGTAHIRVAQLVSEQLELIRSEAVVIPQDVVVRRSACALKNVYIFYNKSRATNVCKILGIYGINVIFFKIDKTRSSHS